MTKDELLLAAEMLEMASNTFSNHGCNDLDKDVIQLIENPEKLCEDIRKWNGDDPWPEHVENIGDSSLMHYLSDKLKESAVEEVDKWISVDSNQKPELNQNVLCIQEGETQPVMAVYTAYGFKVQKYTSEGDRAILTYWTDITHWQPLPSAPKQDKPQ